MDLALVQDLADLAPRLPAGHNNAAGLRTAVANFEKLSQRMATTEGLAARLVKTPLPTLLSKYIVAQPAPDSEDACVDLFLEMISHLTMVTSRLAASGIPAIERLTAARFPQILATILLNTLNLPPAAARRQLTTTFASLISTFTAIVTSNHEPTNKALATHENFSGMLRMACLVHPPGDWKNDIPLDIEKNLTQYLWTVASTLAKLGDFPLSMDDLKRIISVFKFWSGPDNEIPKPAFYSSLSKTDARERFGIEVVVLHNTHPILMTVFQLKHRLSATPLEELAADKDMMDKLFTFIETRIEGTKYGQPSWIDTDGWDATTRTGVNRVRIAGRDGAAQIIAAIAGQISPLPAVVKTHVNQWITGAPEMTGYALVAIANSCQTVGQAAAALAPPSTLPQAITALLVPSAPISILHSTIALLRTVVVPEVNIPRLGRPAFAGTLAVRPFSAETFTKSAMMPVNAFTIIKGFVTRDPEYAAQFFADKQTVVDIGVLYARVDDAKFKSMILDMWTVAVKCLAPVGTRTDTAELAQAWQHVAGNTSLSLLAAALANTRDSEVVLSNACVSLLNVLDNGPPSGEDGPVTDALARAITTAYNGGRTATNGLADIIAPPATNAPKINPETQVVAVAIVNTAKLPALTAAVKEALAKSGAAGRPVAAGADNL